MLRDRAQATNDNKVREQLVEIAVAYEELADDIEAEKKRRQ